MVHRQGPGEVQDWNRSGHSNGCRHLRMHRRQSVQCRQKEFQDWLLHRIRLDIKIFLLSAFKYESIKWNVIQYSRGNKIISLIITFVVKSNVSSFIWWDGKNALEINPVWWSTNKSIYKAFNKLQFHSNFENNHKYCSQRTHSNQQYFTQYNLIEEFTWNASE